MFVACLSICLSGTGVHCDQTVHFSVDLSLWFDSPVFLASWHESMSTYSQPSFSSSTWKRGEVWMCKLGVISQERLKIEVKLLLSANRKSYMPRRLAQQRITSSGLEWPFHPHRALSLRLLVNLSPPIPIRLYTLPYWSNPPFLIFDIRALWRCRTERQSA